MTAILGLRDLSRFLLQRLPLLVGLAALGVFLALGIGVLLQGRHVPVSSIYFTLPPEADAARFHAQSQGPVVDWVIEEAARQCSLPATPEAVAQLRAALDISGVMSASVRREREKQRSIGQNLPPFAPTEYVISFRPGLAPQLDEARQRNLLTAMVRAWAGQFRQNQAQPPGFAGFLECIAYADYPEFPALLKAGLGKLKATLGQRRIGPPALQQLSGKIDDFVEVDLAIFQQQVEQTHASRRPAQALARAQVDSGRLRLEEKSLLQEQAVLDDAFASLDRLKLGKWLATPDAGPGETARPAVTLGQPLLAKVVQNQLSLSRLAAQQAALQQRITQLTLQAENPAAVPAAVQAGQAALEKNYDALLAEARQLVETDGAGSAPGIEISQPAFSTPPPASFLRMGLLGLTFGLTLGLAILLLPIVLKGQG